MKEHTARDTWNQHRHFCRNYLKLALVGLPLVQPLLVVSGYNPCCLVVPLHMSETWNEYSSIILYDFVSVLFQYACSGIVFKITYKELNVVCWHPSSIVISFVLCSIVLNCGWIMQYTLVSSVCLLSHPACLCFC